MRQFIAIVLLMIGAAVVYGTVNDQITVRICIEYFTIGHPRVFSTEDPTLLALGWGLIATWWMGLLLGVPLAMAARLGTQPKRSAASLVRPVAILLGVIAGLAALAGVAGYLAASSGLVYVLEPVASRLPAEKHVPFLISVWIHSAGYLSGFVGGVVLIVLVALSRGKEHLGPPLSKPQ